jgi:protein-disulfide isomerase
MRLKWDVVWVGLLVACALVTTGLVVRREIFPAAQVAGVQKPVFVKDWRALLDGGTRIGRADAPVQIIEFADFECAFCATFHENYKVVAKRHPGKIALTYIHYPLPMHRSAIPAARAAECARVQGRFAEMVDALFAGQKEFAIKPWGDYAKVAGVADPAAFDACVTRTDAVPHVAEGQALGKRIDIQGTPTIVVGGWKTAPGDVEQLDAMVKAVLANKPPL